LAAGLLAGRTTGDATIVDLVALVHVLRSPVSVPF
jgi:hypothetical protein